MSLTPAMIDRQPTINCSRPCWRSSSRDVSLSVARFFSSKQFPLWLKPTTCALQNSCSSVPEKQKLIALMLLRVHAMTKQPLVCLLWYCNLSALVASFPRDIELRIITLPYWCEVFRWVCMCVCLYAHISQQELIRRWDSERELLRCAPQKIPEFAEITQNNDITRFKVIQGHQFCYQSKAHVRFPISD